MPAGGGTGYPPHDLMGCRSLRLAHSQWWRYHRPSDARRERRNTMIVQCITCGKTVSFDQRQCPHCGARIPEGLGFKVGTAISTGFSLFFRNILQFGALGILILSPLALLEWTIGPDALGNQGGRPWSQTDSGYALLFFAMSMVLFNLLSAAIAAGAFQLLRGRPMRVADSLGAGLVRLLPVLGVSICVAIAASLAAGAIIVPAVLLLKDVRSFAGIFFLGCLVIAGIVVAAIIIIRYWVAVPANVVERGGVFGAMARSAGLTRDCRWKVFAVLLVFVILYVVFQAVVTLPLSPQMGFASHSSPGIAVRLIGFVAEALGQSCGAVLACVCYFELRRAKEGTDIEEIAAVFD